MNRFRNPYIKHQLLSIALNGMTKYTTRILPQLLTYYEKSGKLPARLTFALAALISFYRGERGAERYPLSDDASWLDFYAEAWPQVASGHMTAKALVEQVLNRPEHWGHDLAQVAGLVDQVTAYVVAIHHSGVRQALAQIEG
ncbi:hypothetical protein P4S72_29750 [Vibrio sp. PP-XX7]